VYLHSSGARPRLRVGVLLDEMRLMKSLAVTIEDITRCDFADIALVVMHKPPSAPQGSQPSSRAGRYLKVLRDPVKRRGILYEQYLKFDSRLTSLPDDPIAPVDCSALLAGVEKMDVEPLTKGFVHRFPDDALDRIRSRQLDVLIRFGFNILRGPVLTAAKYGVWSYHHGDNDYYRGGPALFWEIREGSPTSAVILQVLTEELDAGLVLSKAMFRTEPGLSLARNRLAPYWGAADMMIAQLRALHEYGWEHVRTRAVPPQPYQGKKKLYRKPTNMEMVRWLVPAVTRKVAGRVHRALKRPENVEWRIGLRRNGRLPDDGDLQGWQWLPAPAGRYFADPFLVRRNGRLWLFAEDYRESDNKAVLSVCELDEDLRPGEMHVCLEKAWHLSYPHVFEHDGEMFMIPESNRAGRVELYRASTFPTVWKLEKVLFEGIAADTTAFFEAGFWWFFVPLVEPHGRGLTLLLFYSNTLTGDWTWHPANPISRDVRNARGAGAIFRSGGRCIRPSQDGSIRYGYSFSFHEISKLNTGEYEEQVVRSVLPEGVPGMLGTHTYNALECLEAIDGLFATQASATPVR
jgi:hypothetical protein